MSPKLLVSALRARSGRPRNYSSTRFGRALGAPEVIRERASGAPWASPKLLVSALRARPGRPRSYSSAHFGRPLGVPEAIRQRASGAPRASAKLFVSALRARPEPLRRYSPARFGRALGVPRSYSSARFGRALGIRFLRPAPAPWVSCILEARERWIQFHRAREPASVGSGLQPLGPAPRQQDGGSRAHSGSPRRIPCRIAERLLRGARKVACSALARARRFTGERPLGGRTARIFVPHKFGANRVSRVTRVSRVSQSRQSRHTCKSCQPIVSAVSHV